ncbi:MAG: universal stress protein [Hyphomicrobiales bacterium]|nr:universal stress protein [Hyphomicrobiales bacterium]MCP5373831.1 universal stress protein [Hyphomicrobiales bacterium]
MYQNILICVDGSEHARRAAAVGADLAARMDARLHLVTVVRPFKVTPDLQRFLTAENMMGEPKYVLDEMTKGILYEARKVASAAQVRQIETHVVEGKPARAIVEFASDNHVDLVVMGARGVGEPDSALLGSVSHKVSNLARCTVMLVR